MNQSFDINRWSLLVGSHWSVNRKKYTLSLIAIAGLLMVWYVFILFADAYKPVHESIQLGAYYFGLFAVGCLFASMLFAELASKSKGINFLSIPASHLEKLLCSLFYGVVVFFVFYTIIFYGVDIIMVKLGNTIAHDHWIKTYGNANNFEPAAVVNVFVMPQRPAGAPNVFLYILLAYFAVQAAFILGSVYFPKFSFIKTVISLLLFGLFYVFFAGEVLHSIMPHGNFYKSITSYRFYTVLPSAQGININASDTTDKIVTLPGWIDDCLSYVVMYAFAPVFWMITYFRLKEKEI